MLAGLNPEQLAAVTRPPTHALILAGAGSGKTRVLTTRIAWLLQTGQVSPGGILAVTFTNKAAREMVTRLTTMLPLNVRGMWIGTFHGLCNRLLRAHHKLVNLPSTFQILDTQDQLSAIKRLCKQFNVDEERFPPKQLQWFIAGCKEDGERPAAEMCIRDRSSTSWCASPWSSTSAKPRSWNTVRSISPFRRGKPSAVSLSASGANVSRSASRAAPRARSRAARVAAEVAAKSPATAAARSAAASM